MGFRVERVLAREIIDSRGNPTLEVEMVSEDGIKCYASVPSGVSVGAFEAIELRDRDLSRYHGMGVTKAIKIVEEKLFPRITDRQFESIREFDRFLIAVDGTDNKSAMGANTSLALSLAFTRSLAAAQNLKVFELLRKEFKTQSQDAPTPMLNIINGGKHANNDLVIQEFMIVPVLKTTIQEKIRLSCEFFADLRSKMKTAGYSTNVGDEGGFAPMVSEPEEALDIIMEVMADYGNNFRIALDAAASTFYDGRSYTVTPWKNTMNSSELVEYYQKLIRSYPIISIEDPMAEDDFAGWKEITEKLGRETMLIGDDIFVTNTKRLQHGIDNKIGNAILIKPNQIGTVTESVEAIELARKNNYEVIVSHRSGETEDVALAHLAFGLGATYIKAGAPCRSERVAKYNELIRIC